MLKFLFMASLMISGQNIFAEGAKECERRTLPLKLPAAVNQGLDAIRLAGDQLPSHLFKAILRAHLNSNQTLRGQVDDTLREQLVRKLSDPELAPLNSLQVFNEIVPTFTPKLTPAYGRQTQIKQRLADPKRVLELIWQFVNRQQMATTDRNDLFKFILGSVVLNADFQRDPIPYMRDLNQRSLRMDMNSRPGKTFLFITFLSQTVGLGDFVRLLKASGFAPIVDSFQF